MDLHSHSSYSDGKNTPEEMIEAAIEVGYEAIAITDHVWKTSTWVPQYAAHLDYLKYKYRNQIQLYSGIEAKVVSLDGDIDADPSFDARVDLILGSIHRIPHSSGYFKASEHGTLPQNDVIDKWLEAFYHMLDNPRVDIIAHPLSELKGFHIREDQLPVDEIVDRIADSGKILELNVRYNAPDQPVMKLSAARGIPFLISSDSHSVEHLRLHSQTIRKHLDSGQFHIIDIQKYLADKRSKRKP